MELRVLRYFLTVAEEENITRAARLLHITQPTLSRQLIQLEEELGVKLLERSGHRIYLTEDGELLRRRAREIIGLTEKTQAELACRGDDISGLISIGSGEYAGSRHLAEMLAGFQREHPLVRFEIYSGNSDNIKERIEQGILDIGLLMEPVDISRYDFIRLPEEERWGALVREDSPLAEKDSVTPGDLARIPVIMTRRELLRGELLHWFAAEAEHLEIVAGGNLLYNMAQMAKSGLGTVITPMLECTYDGLRFVPLVPELKTGTVLVWKKSQPLSPAVQALIGYAKREIQR